MRVHYEIQFPTIITDFTQGMRTIRGRYNKWKKREMNKC